MEPRALWVVALLATVALAGCTESGEGTDAIELVSMPADPKVDPLVLEAKVSADEYKWDMGDGRPAVEGKRVEHVYGVTDGQFSVKLTTVSGGVSEEHAPLKVTFGTGQNEAPSLRLDVDWQWVQVGEEVTFSVAGSQDAEGDPVLVQWLCTRKSDIGLAGGAHAHGGVGGVQYGTSNTNVIPHFFQNATGTLTANRTADGDLCAAMADNAFAAETGIKGAFEERGIYEITLLARDPGHFAIPATVTMYVTDEPRSSGWYNETFSDSIETPLPEDADPVAQELDSTDHFKVHTFDIQYPTLGFSASISDDGGDGVPVEIEYEIKKGDSSKIPATSDDSSKPADYFKVGSHTAIVTLRQGSNVDYQLDISVQYITDPTLIFDDPGGH